MRPDRTERKEERGDDGERREGDEKRRVKREITRQNQDTKEEE